MKKQVRLRKPRPDEPLGSAPKVTRTVRLPTPQDAKIDAVLRRLVSRRGIHTTRSALHQAALYLLPDDLNAIVGALAAVQAVACREIAWSDGAQPTFEEIDEVLEITVRHPGRVSLDDLGDPDRPARTVPKPRLVQGATGAVPNSSRRKRRSSA
jgi:hypothetical protein